MIEQREQGIYTIYCDVCNKRQVSGTSPASVHQRAYQLGWNKQGGKHVCPVCAIHIEEAKRYGESTTSEQK